MQENKGFLRLMEFAEGEGIMEADNPVGYQERGLPMIVSPAKQVPGPSISCTVTSGRGWSMGYRSPSS
jgi:hypothetical protein